MMNKYKHSSKAKNSKKKNKKTGNLESQKLNADWIYGFHPVLAALDNFKRNCLRIIISNTISKGLERDIENACRKITGMPNREKMNREQISSLLPLGAVHQGIALLTSPLNNISIEDIIRETEGKAEATLIVLDQATDPRNVGAVMRSAAAFGASAVILQDRHAPQLSGALCKAASGAVERVSLIRVVNLARAISNLKNAGFWAVGLDASAKRTIAQADLSGRTILVLGAEGAGLRRLTRDTCDETLKVPIKKNADSLNLSNAAAVALYEIERKR